LGRRPTTIAVTAALLLALAIAVPFQLLSSGPKKGVQPPPDASSFTSQSPATMLDTSLAAAVHAGSFELRVEGGHDNGELVMVSRNGGEIISSAGDITVTGRTIYMKGQRLLASLGAARSHLSNNIWTSVPQVGMSLDSLASSASISGELGLLRLTGLQRSGGAASSGTIMLRGDLPTNAPITGNLSVHVPATLTISTRAPYYPISLSIAAGSASATFTYSRWGAVPAITRPASAKPLDSLLPPSGTRDEQRILRKVSVQSSDVRGGLKVVLIPGGDLVQGQVTLNFCSNNYASESLRVARRQVAVGSNFSTEAVLYRNSLDTALAFAELHAAVAHCDLGAPTPGVKQVTPPHLLRAWPRQHGVNRLAYVDTAVIGGRVWRSYTAYLRRGRVLLAVYINAGPHASPVTIDGRRSPAAIVSLFEKRLAALPVSAVR
jgi:hypothetical protein